MPENAPVQTGFFPDETAGEGAWEKLDGALDAIYERYGPEAVKMGSNIED